MFILIYGNLRQPRSVFSWLLPGRWDAHVDLVQLQTGYHAGLLTPCTTGSFSGYYTSSLLNGQKLSE